MKRQLCQIKQELLWRRKKDWTILLVIALSTIFVQWVMRVWCDSLEQKSTYLINIPVWSKLYHDFQLFHLHINWIIVFAKEHLYGKESSCEFTLMMELSIQKKSITLHTWKCHLNYLDFMGKNGGTLLHDEVYVSQCNILNLWFSRKQCHKRWGHFLAKVSDNICAGNKFHLQKNHLQLLYIQKGQL